MLSQGFPIPQSNHPIVPVMLGDEVLAQKMSEYLLELGVLAIGFFYPVVPKNEARVRVQISSCHSKDNLDKAVEAFKIARKRLAFTSP